jgi:SsrA-binding protein
MANTAESEHIKLIASNPAARANYHIEQVTEAGLVLTGTEVKSLRQNAPNLKDAFVEVRALNTKSNRKPPSAGGKGGELRLEAWLLNTHIAPYSHGNIWNHDPLRPRKLLLSRKEISRIFGATTREGMTVVPLRMYFKKGIAKVEIGLGKGKKKYDKRQDVARRDSDRQIERATKRSRKS